MPRACCSAPSRPSGGAAMRPLGRRLHQADQDDDRADRVLHDRRGHREDGRHEGRRLDRPEGAGLFRSRVDGRAADRPGRRPCREAGQRHPRQRRDARSAGGQDRTSPSRSRCTWSTSCSTSSRPRLVAGVRRPATSCRSCSCPCCSGWRCCKLGQLASSAAAPHRSARRGAVRHGRPDRPAGADRRVRSDGVHDRPLWHRHAALAREADGGCLHHVRAVRRHRARASIAALCGFSLWKFIRYIKEEILLVLGTSSSESALPRMMAKLEHLGCEPVGRGARHPDRLFLQPRWHVDLHDDCGRVRRAGAGRPARRWSGYLTLLGVLMLTSKGAAAVTGGGFITLAATLASTSPRCRSPA